MRGETSRRIRRESDIIISIHSPHARGDPLSIPEQMLFSDFNPLPSCEGRQSWKRRWGKDGYFNPLPSCEGRPFDRQIDYNAQRISIHSPHARGDRRLSAGCSAPEYFNPLPSCEGRQCAGRAAHPSDAISIHSPHARGDEGGAMTSTDEAGFQSTPLMRGETGTTLNAMLRDIFQSTPLMRGETE